MHPNGSRTSKATTTSRREFAKLSLFCGFDRDVHCVSSDDDDDDGGDDDDGYVDDDD